MSYYSQAFESRRLHPKVSHRKFNGPVNFESQSFYISKTYKIEERFKNKQVAAAGSQCH